MKLEPSELKTGLDRLATNEEIRAAVSLLPECFLKNGKERLFEVPSDKGGYVLIEFDEDGMELVDDLTDSDDYV
jgi:hypothetical protein